MSTHSCTVCVTIFSTGGKFRPVSTFTKLHGLTLVIHTRASLYLSLSSFLLPFPPSFSLSLPCSPSPLFLFFLFPSLSLPLPPSLPSSFLKQDACSGRTALHYAVEAENFILVNFLLENGANVNAATFAGKQLISPGITPTQVTRKCLYT